MTKPGARLECSECGSPPSWHVSASGLCPGARFAIAWLIRR